MSSKKKKKKQKGQMSTVGAVSKIPQKGNPELCSKALQGKWAVCDCVTYGVSCDRENHFVLK